MTRIPPIDIAGVYADMLRARHEEAGPKPTRDDTLMRGSDALMCHRKIGFKAHGFDPVHEYPNDTLLAFRMGNLIHEDIQAALIDLLGDDIEVEFMASYSGDVDVSGSGDGVYLDEDLGPVVVEIKTMKEYAYNLATIGKGNPRWVKKGEVLTAGPKREHLVQAGLYAMAPQVEAEFVHMVYINKNGGAAEQWLYHIDDRLPHLDGDTVRAMTNRWLDDLAEIEAQVNDGLLPARWAPGHGGIVHQPPEYRADSGYWECRFCEFRDLCAAFPPEAVRIEPEEEAA